MDNSTDIPQDNATRPLPAANKTLPRMEALLKRNAAQYWTYRAAADSATDDLTAAEYRVKANEYGQAVIRARRALQAVGYTPERTDRLEREAKQEWDAEHGKRIKPSFQEGAL